MIQNRNLNGRFIFNSATWLNALEKGVDIQSLYIWLGSVKSFENEEPIVATLRSSYELWAISALRRLIQTC